MFAKQKPRSLLLFQMNVRAKVLFFLDGDPFSPLSTYIDIDVMSLYNSV